MSVGRPVTSVGVRTNPPPRVPEVFFIRLPAPGSSHMAAVSRQRTKDLPTYQSWGPQQTGLALPAGSQAVSEVTCMQPRVVARTRDQGVLGRDLNPLGPCLVQGLGLGDGVLQWESQGAREGGGGAAQWRRQVSEWNSQTE